MMKVTTMPFDPNIWENVESRAVKADIFLQFSYSLFGKSFFHLQKKKWFPLAGRWHPSISLAEIKTGIWM